MVWRLPSPPSMTNKMRVILAAAILLGLAVAAGVQSKNFSSLHIFDGNELYSQPKDALDSWLDRLEIFECEGCAPDYKRLDDNGKYSYSCLQFQKQTFVQEVLEYDLLPEAEAHEIENMIYDCEFQKKLAREMFLNDAKAWYHWKTSVKARGLGMPPKID